VLVLARAAWKDVIRRRLGSMSMLPRRLSSRLRARLAESTWVV
jgi:hypothetical protein